MHTYWHSSEKNGNAQKTVKSVRQTRSPWQEGFVETRRFEPEVKELLTMRETRINRGSRSDGRWKITQLMLVKNPAVGYDYFLSGENLSA